MAVFKNVFGNTVVLKQIVAQKEKSVNGIYIPESSKIETFSIGEVVQLGEITVDVYVGDVVYYIKNCGYEVSVDGETYIVLRVPDLLVSR